MRIKVLGCYGGQLRGYALSSFLVNESILLDAGCPTRALTLEEQRHIHHLFVSHVHLDHIQDIAFLADNRALKRMGEDVKRTISIHTLQENIDIIKEHFLNDLIWPDFTVIPTVDDPILIMQPVTPYESIVVDGIKVTSIPVAHPVPCTAFMLEDNGCQFIYSADTGVTDELWRVANEQANLKGIIIDCSFPNAYEKLAHISGHLTPHLMAQEVKKLNAYGEVPIYLYHMKPETMELMIQQIEAERIPNLHLLDQTVEILVGEA
ncbi:MAG: MBL fold metallo-hydrolase [Zetaproteobacteria bacterium CG_4_9_14_3_um_filter_49_83]|nr:MAG: MBL fold metallo-hydrolase [Zetaproteobacteria bacterium CG1_02_49_23]PIQ34428.1 MAG: MBL fold metallo-hydrolase [Zetaproteobacteria bacterium CG17_big_fil_post_rev_8_21_14_2_50_50_13]PIV29037.1 MAG: MBL fold metallo-hydrolase [Zetaproteobacteria bacterium CG02_land_8_20_14_3_00_50_9]PIY56411.1 MAG: MBL fold metallo-hydrolase [Zetaproteobacteria bacterium CG_4_10_14_0_8_um_filter_49_80]PJA34050.1 MAG: MBL fold metallo-hydrolase [Zetaproteobacteria bacterium CG_4_9_14_3_um_filter_49_83]